MAGGKASIDYKVCMACGACVQACPFSCLGLIKCSPDKYKKVYPELVNAEKCTGCGLCKGECPIECIRVVNSY